jgi:hypothetical protein
MFDANCQSSDDANTLLCHCNAFSTQNPNPPSFTFNIAGLPEMLGFNWGAKPNQDAVQACSAPQPLPAANQPPNTTNFADFAWEYWFSLELHNLLQKAHVTGPHLLCLITDTYLKEAGLNFAQLAKVRDAYDRWLEGVSTRAQAKDFDA